MKKNIGKYILILAVVTTLILSACLFAACDEKEEVKPLAFSQDRVFKLDAENINFMGNPHIVVAAVIALALDEDETYFEFKSDGTVHGQISTKAGILGIAENLLENETIKGLLGDSFGDLSIESIGNMIAQVDLAEGLEFYAEPMFPGFTKCLEDGNADAAFKLIENTLGLNIKGVDFSKGALKEAVEKMGQEYATYKTLHLPSNLLEIIPKDAQLTLSADWEYNLVHLKGEDGAKHDALYIGGDVAHDPATTQPFAIFTYTENQDEPARLELRIEFMSITLALVEKTAA